MSGGSQRVTRLSRRLQKIDEEDLNLALSQPGGNVEDFNLSLTEPRDTEMRDLQDDEDADDLNLFLSQSQSSQPTLPLNEATVKKISESAANVKINLTSVQNIIQKNHDILTQQNEMLLRLISDISANVDDINDRVNMMEKQFDVMNNKVCTQGEMLENIQVDVGKLQKSMRILKKKQNKPNISNDYEQRLLDVENKLNVQKDNTLTSASTSTNDNDIICVDDEIIDENCVVISNLPETENFDADVSALMWTGLCINAQTKTVTKLETNNGKSKVKVELHSLKDKIEVMKNKRQLRNTNEYCNVFIDNFKSRADILMEHNLKTILKTMPRGSMYNIPNGGRVQHNRGYNRD